MTSPPAAPPPPPPFPEFPLDVQINILSFLTPSELSSFACTSHHSASLSASEDLWISMSDRRWGSQTLLRRWGFSTTSTAATLRRLYRSLSRWENLIGFWRRIGDPPSLLFFQWGPSSITGSRVSPSRDPGSYGVVKDPFIWLGLSPDFEQVTYLRPGPASDADLVPVTLSFVGPNHFILDEDPGGSENSAELEGTSPPDRLTSEVYQYFANRTSPGGEKASRRQRKKGKERLGRRRRWESEHFLKIDNYCPTPTRPLQGIWKGICEDMTLEFYLVSYDDVGGITCRRVGVTPELFSGYSLVFWTSNARFLEPPFSREEQELYSTRVHIQPVIPSEDILEGQVVSRILSINSSYDLVIPDLTDSSGDAMKVEGRIWEYENGTFCFGFLRNNFVVDLKHVTIDGHLIDAIEYFFNVPFL